MKKTKFNKIDKSLVITSINRSNHVIHLYSKYCYKNLCNFIIVADKKTPKYKKDIKIKFLDIKTQKKLNLKLPKKIPFNNYSRKNIGYLYSMLNNSKIILETDDDNAPLKNFFFNLKKNQKAYLINNKGWINIYNYFLTNNKMVIWPRGFPLDRIRFKEKLIRKKNKIYYAPIQQRLANGNPDVDAIYRMINKNINIKFKKNLNLVLNNESYCPFNSQNTIWFEDAFPLMYLPSYCSMRATDIWRSYISLRIMREFKWNMLFSSPTVEQDRNYHDLQKDFKDEIPVYNDTKKVFNALNEIELFNKKNHIIINLFMCYQKLVKEKIFDKKELDLVKLWCKDISKILPNLVKI